MRHPQLLVHSDARALTHVMPGRIEPSSSNEEIVHNFVQYLSHEFDRKTIILPAFNYDFTSTGFFDVAQDRSQVGAITEAARTKLNWKRNATPVYSFILSNFFSNRRRVSFQKKTLCSVQSTPER